MSTKPRRPLRPSYAPPLIALGEQTGFTQYEWADVSEVDRPQLWRLWNGLSEFGGDEVSLRLGHGAMKSPDVSVFDVDEFYRGIGFRSMLPRGYRDPGLT